MKHIIVNRISLTELEALKNVGYTVSIREAPTTRISPVYVYADEIKTWKLKSQRTLHKKRRK